MSNYNNASPYAAYLQMLGRWPTNVALASQWFIYFDFSSVKALQGNLQTQLSNKESAFGNYGWRYSDNVTRYLLDGQLQYSFQNLMGCVFARQVDLPSENIIAGNEGLDYGGYMAPATTGNREKYKKLSVTFLENNASFLDLVIRPWTILVGYNGLVARAPNSEKNVKCRFADVVMLAKTGAGNQMGIRKAYRFYNIAPVAIDGEEYSYMADGMKYSKVSFVYDGYFVQDGNTAQYLNLNNSFLSYDGLLGGGDY
jgi:hypothetical protein